MKNNAIIISFLLILLSFSSIAQDAYFNWATTIETTWGGKVFDLHVDEYGNVYTTGSFSGTTDFDPGPDKFEITAYGLDDDIFIRKLDKNGKFVWAYRLGGDDDDVGYSITTDKDGNIYVGGKYGKKANFNPKSTFNANGSGYKYLSTVYNSEGFILKLNSSLNVSWVYPGGGAVKSIAIDSKSNVVAAGEYSYNVDFDYGLGTEMEYSNGALYMYVLQVSEYAQFQWVESFKGPEGSFAHELAISKTDQIYLTGGGGGSMQNGPSIIDLTEFHGGRDILLFKLGTNGERLWGFTIGSEAWDESFGLALSDDGYVYITGWYFGTTDFDPDTSTHIISFQAGTNPNAFVAKYDTTGKFHWVKTFGTSSSERGTDIVVDRFGGVYSTGYYSTTIDLNPNNGVSTAIARGSTDAYIQKLDNNGEFVWAKNYGGTGGDYPEAIELDGEGNIYTSGYFGATFDADPGSGYYELNTPSGKDPYVLKFSQDSCYNLGADINKLNEATCYDSCFISVSPIGGKAPFEYSWDGNQNDSIFEKKMSESRFHNISITAANGCVKSTDFLIESPQDLSGFDLSSTLSISEFRPGFEADVWITPFNLGCDTVVGLVKLVVDTGITFLSSSITPDYIIGDTLMWEIGNLFFKGVPVGPKVKFQSKLTLQIGDSIRLKTMTSPESGDVNLINNNKNYVFPVVNGYDPNDMKGYPNGECSANYLQKSTPIEYTIRFQNTGNSKAINIRVSDSLSNQLDITSIKLLSSSHPLTIDIKAADILDFNFDGINLPDSTSDLEGSQGFVTFQITPKASTPDGYTLNNTAGIYFDYNPPVITNTVTYQLKHAVPSCSMITSVLNQQQNSFALYPNPTNSQVNILTDSNNFDIVITGVSGEVLIREHNKLRINFSQYPSGIYFVSLKTQSGSQSLKLVKK
jgi:hypothetical protein